MPNAKEVTEFAKPDEASGEQKEKLAELIDKIGNAVNGEELDDLVTALGHVFADVVVAGGYRIVPVLNFLDFLVKARRGSSSDLDKCDDPECQACNGGEAPDGCTLH